MQPELAITQLFGVLLLSIIRGEIFIGVITHLSQPRLRYKMKNTSYITDKISRAINTDNMLVCTHTHRRDSKHQTRAAINTDSIVLCIFRTYTKTF